MKSVKTWRAVATFLALLALAGTVDAQSKGGGGAGKTKSTGGGTGGSGGGGTGGGSGGGGVGGGSPGRITGVRTHSEVVQEFHNHLKRDPAGALREVRGYRDVLDRAKQAELGHQAAETLIGELIRGKDATTSLTRFAEADRDVAELGIGNKLPWKGVRTHLEDQAVATGLEGLVKAGEGGNWERAHELAKVELGRPYAKDATELGKTLGTTAGIAKQLAAIKQAEAFLEPTATSGGTRPSVTETAVADLPEPARASFGKLKALVELDQAMRAPQGERADVATLKGKLAAVREGTSDPDFAAKLQQELAFKSFLDGNYKEARELLPEVKTPEGAKYAANLLRDLKTLVGGKGEVTSEAGRQAVERGPNNSGEGNRGPPPGVRLLLPEAPGDSYRPAVGERATADLPGLGQEIAKQTEKWAKDAKQDVGAEREKAQTQATQNMKTLQAVHQDAHRRIRHAADVRDAVSKILDRPLDPIEQAWIRDRLLCDKTAEEIAAEMKEEAWTRERRPCRMPDEKPDERKEKVEVPDRMPDAKPADERKEKGEVREAKDGEVGGNKLIGKWRPADGKAPIVIEFMDKGKLVLSIDIGGKSEKIEGTYKLDGNKIEMVMSFGGKEQKETVTITKLTDNEMSAKDSKDKEEKFKKVK